MRLLASLTTAAMLIGGLSATSADPASATDANTDDAVLTVNEILADPSVEVIDEAQALDELGEAGFTVSSVDETKTEVAVSLGSELGDGSTVDTSLSMDLAENTGTVTIISEALPTEETVLALEIHELTEDLIDVTITDTATGEAQRVTNEEGQGAAVPLIVGIPIVVSVLEALIAAMTAVVISGVTYVVVSKAVAAIAKSGSDYQHFKARRVKGMPLVIGNGLSYSGAVLQVKQAKDVWSWSQNGAKTVCSAASGGKTPIGPEIDKSGSYKLYHYHTSPRNGAHCFYGPQL